MGAYFTPPPLIPPIRTIQLIHPPWRPGMFYKAATRRAFEDVVEQIREAIVAGRLKPGDRLPPQRELKELFQVSRATIMEALRVLEKADLITIRPGATGGAFVSHATTDTLADSFLLLLDLAEVSIEELGEFRERVEAGTAYWAASRATDDQLRDLQARYQLLCDLAASKAPWPTFLAEDFNLHHAVAEYSRNRPSVAAMKAITLAMKEAYTYISHGLYDKVLADVGGLVEAICERNPELAEQRMKSHVAYFYEDMMANRSAKLGKGHARIRVHADVRPGAPSQLPASIEGGVRLSGVQESRLVVVDGSAT